MANVTINSLTAKTTPVDADVTILIDSAASNDNKKVTFGNIKAFIKAYTDTLYAAIGVVGTVTNVSSANADIGVATGTTTPVLTLNSNTAVSASTIVKRDASSNIYVNNYFANTASTVSAAGTTVLTVASARTQNLTGSSTQTFQLPDATTLALSSIFEFNNNSSSSLLINNAGAVLQHTVPAGGAVQCFCTSIGTANGTWDFHALAPQSVTWSSGITGLTMNSALSTTPSVGSGASSSTAPSFIPQRTASTTGFGGDGTNLYATIAGTARATISASGITATNLSGTNTGDQTTIAGITGTMAQFDTAVTDGNIVYQSQALGTPASGTVTNLTGTASININGTVGATTPTTGKFSSVETTGNIELGSASATTLSGSAGVLSVEGVTVPTISSTNTLTNKRITPRVGTTTSSATPTINTDNVDIYSLTAQTVDITSFTTNLTGTPTDGQKLIIQITGTAARAITWGASFEASTVALPTTTVTTARLDVGFIWNTVTSKWRCIASA